MCIKDVGILYLFIKFELDQSTDNRDLLLDRNHWKHKNTEIETDSLLTGYSRVKTDILPSYRILSGVKRLSRTSGTGLSLCFRPGRDIHWGKKVSLLCLCVFPVFFPSDNRSVL